MLLVSARLSVSARKLASRLSPRTTAALLSGVVVVLLLANLVGHFALAIDSIWARLLDVNQEKNFATAFSVLLLLWCAVLLRQISRLRSRDSFVSHWRSLSFIFVGMAADEWLLLHERMNAFLDDRFQTSGFLYYDWVIPGSLFVLSVGLIYARFLRCLPTATRDRFLFSGGLYVSGALGMEMVSGYYVDRYGLSNRAVLALLNGVEESAEMFGLVVFIYALMIYSRRLHHLAYRAKLHNAKLHRAKIHTAYIKAKQHALAELTQVKLTRSKLTQSKLTQSSQPTQTQQQSR